MKDNIEVLKVRCPHCGIMADYYGNPCRPFCSSRCQQIDLGTWADEGFRIAGDRAPDEQEQES